MSPFPSPPAPAPYSHDLERLDAEFAWVAARCRALAARKAVDDAALEAAGSLSTGSEEHGSLHTKAARLEALEANQRAHIDRRVAVSEPMGLETVAEEYGLDAVERTVLLLALIPTLGMGLYDTLGDLGSYAFGYGAVSPELVAVFDGLDLMERREMFRRLGPKGVLVQAGLVRVGWDEDDEIQDFWGSNVYLLPKAFAMLTGEAAASDGRARCPRCARPTRVVAEA